MFTPIRSRGVFGGVAMAMVLIYFFVFNFVGVSQSEPTYRFHQIFRIYLPKEYPELIFIKYLYFSFVSLAVGGGGGGGVGGWGVGVGGGVFDNS